MIHIEGCELATANRTAAILENPEKITFSLCSSPSHGSMSKKVKSGIFRITPNTIRLSDVPVKLTRTTPDRYPDPASRS